MSLNKHKPHIFVLPEDDANRQIANGFLLVPELNQRTIQILPPSGGWKKVLTSFEVNHVSAMRKHEKRMIVLLIDFDGREDRLNYIKNKIPEDLVARVFVLGVLSEPEKLKRNISGLNTFKDIGKALSQDCVGNTRNVWGHDLLKHNEAELDRMILSVKPFLFN